MKNFLQVLLVGTILVSAGDGYSQIIPGYTSPETERYLSGGFSSSTGASSAAATSTAANGATAGANLGYSFEYAGGYKINVPQNALNVTSSAQGGVYYRLPSGSGYSDVYVDLSTGTGMSQFVGADGIKGEASVIQLGAANKSSLSPLVGGNGSSVVNNASTAGSSEFAPSSSGVLDDGYYNVGKGNEGLVPDEFAEWDYSNVEGGDGFDWGNAGPGNQGGSGVSGTDWDNLDTDSPHLYGDDVASGGSGGGVALGSGAGVSGDALGGISQGIAGSIGAGLSNVGATFGNYFDALTGTLTKPFSIIKGLWDGEGGAMWKGFTDGLGRIPENVQAIFGAGDKVLSGTSAVDSILKAQKIDASKLTAAQQAELANKIAQTFPIRIWNYGEYATVIMQSLEAGKQNDTTKEVKVKAENGLLASQGASTDSTVGGVSLEGTNLASAASQMAWLLDANPVDLNLLKTNDLDLKKDKDQKTLRQRRDLLLQMYATSAQIIAEGSNDISEKFYERIEQLSESLPGTVGSLGSASVLNDSERYPYFEMIRQTALSATQLGLKGASILPNLRIVAPKSQEQ